MRDLIHKRAGIPIGSVDELVKAVGKSGVVDDASGAVRKALGEGGTGSIVLDGLIAAPKYLLPFGGTKIPRAKPGVIFKNKRINTVGERLTDRAEDAMWTMKKHLADADMRAGKRLFDSTKSDLFKTKVSIKGNQAEDGIIHGVDIDTAKMTAPFSKAKNTLVPMAGALWLSSKIYPVGQEGGVGNVTENSDRENSLRP